MPIENVSLPFEVRLQHREGMVVLEFSGELDLSGHEEAAVALEDAVRGEADAVLVNLRGLSFMDSTGLNCLLRAKALADVSGTRIAVLNGSGPPHRLIELTGMDGLIEIVDDVAQLHSPLVQPE